MPPAEPLPIGLPTDTPDRLTAPLQGMDNLPTLRSPQLDLLIIPPSGGNQPPTISRLRREGGGQHDTLMGGKAGQLATRGDGVKVAGIRGRTNPRHHLLAIGRDG